MAGPLSGEIKNLLQTQIYQTFQPALTFPGWLSLDVRLECKPKTEPDIFSDILEAPAGALDKSARRLLLAIVAQALREARWTGKDRTSQLIKQDAIEFLRSGFALTLLQASGSTRLSQEDINKFCVVCEANWKSNQPGQPGF
jgi:hypothetical protein